MSNGGVHLGISSGVFICVFIRDNVFYNAFC